METNKAHKIYKKYLIKHPEGFIEVDYSFFESIKEWIHAYSLGLQIYSEINECLKTEGIKNIELKVGPLKVLNGLSRTLNELNSRFPCLLETIHKESIFIDGIKVIKC